MSKLIFNFDMPSGTSGLNGLNICKADNTVPETFSKKDLLIEQKFVKTKIGYFIKFII